MPRNSKSTFGYRLDVNESLGNNLCHLIIFQRYDFKTTQSNWAKSNQLPRYAANGKKWVRELCSRFEYILNKMVWIAFFRQHFSLNEPTSSNWSNKTKVFIGFLDVSCVAYKRTVYMTWDNFFGKNIPKNLSTLFWKYTIFTLSKIAASVGGVFGFCLGASIISFIEVIYFVVVRVCGRMLSYLWIPNRSYKRNKQLPIGTYEKPAKHINRIHAGWTIRRLVNLSFLWRKFRRS